MIFDIRDLSFSDFEIRASSIDRTARLLTFKMEGAWSDRRIGEGDLVIYDWGSLTQRRYTADVDTWTIIPIGQEERIRYILEVRVESDQIVLCGFSEDSNQWIEFVAVGGRSEYRTYL